MIPPPAPTISQCPQFPMQQIPLGHSYTYNVMPPSQSQFNNQVSGACNLILSYIEYLFEIHSSQNKI